MAIVIQTDSLSNNDIEDAAVVSAVPSASLEREHMLAVVRERLFRSQTPSS